MNSYQPSSWGKRLVSALLLLIGIAVTARVIYDLLLPLLPVAIALCVVGTAYLAASHRRGQ